MALLLASPVAGRPNSAAAQPQRSEPKYVEKLYKEVRHQLVMLRGIPSSIILRIKSKGEQGDFIRPGDPAKLEVDAESAVKSIEGVASVVNNIEILPPSPMMTNSAGPSIAPSMGMPPSRATRFRRAIHPYHREGWQRHAGRCGG